MNKFIFYIFLYGVLLSSLTNHLPFGINVTIYDIVLVFCFGFIFVLKAIDLKSEISITFSKDITLIFLFILGSLLSAFTYGTLATSVIILSQYLFAILIQKTILTYFLNKAIHRENILLKIVDFYVYSFSIVLIIGILAYLNLMPNSSSYFSVNGRLISTRGNANDLAKFIVYSLPIIFMFIDIKRKTLFSYLLLLLSIISLILTGSFGGIIYAIVTVFYYFLAKIVFISKPFMFKKGNILIKRKIINMKSLFTASFIVVALFYIISNPPKIFEERVLAASDLSEAGSASIKLSLMNESISVILSNFFAGVGLGNYLNISAYFTNVHNFYLLVFAETGILGFVGLVGFLAYIFIKSLKSLKQADINTKKIIIGLNASMFGVLISMTTNTHTYSRSTWLLIIVLWAFSETIIKRKRADL